jgi:hypothetical protein
VDGSSGDQILICLEGLKKTIGDRLRSVEIKFLAAVPVRREILLMVPLYTRIWEMLGSDLDQNTG